MSTSATLPAFPVSQQASHPGVSRRDWFAAMALTGVVAQGLEVMGDRVVSESERNMMLAQRAYGLAEAMLQLSDAYNQRDAELAAAAAVAPAGAKPTQSKPAAATNCSPAV